MRCYGNEEERQQSAAVGMGTLGKETRHMAVHAPAEAHSVTPRGIAAGSEQRSVGTAEVYRSSGIRRQQAPAKQVQRLLHTFRAPYAQ